MTPKKKTALRCAGLAIVVGALLVLAAFVMTRGDLARLSTAETETNTYEITEPFTGVDIRVPSADVRFAASEDGKTRVESTHSTRLREIVKVADGVLNVVQVDAGRWYEHIGFFFGADESVTVYLPADALDSLVIQTASGEVNVPEGLSFLRAEVRTTSGDIRFFAACEHLTLGSTSGEITADGMEAERIGIATTSGDILLRSVIVRDELDAQSVSGELTLEAVTAGKAYLETTSGEVELSGTAVRSELFIDTVSGDVELDRSEGNAMYIHTTSGDVTGTLPRAKDFQLHSTSGRGWCSAYDSAGGVCEVTTMSGDIVLYVAE